MTEFKKDDLKETTAPLIASHNMHNLKLNIRLLLQNKILGDLEQTVEQIMDYVRIYQVNIEQKLWMRNTYTSLILAGFLILKTYINVVVAHTLLRSKLKAF